MVICNTVENIGIRFSHILWKQPSAINDALYPTILRIDDHYLIGCLDIGPYLSVDVFQFVQPTYRSVLIFNHNTAFESEILIHKEQSSRAI